MKQLNDGHADDHVDDHVPRCPEQALGRAAAQASLAGLPPELAATVAEDPRLQQLFRHFLRQGRLHPLYPLMLRYRAEPWLEEHE